MILFGLTLLAAGILFLSGEYVRRRLRFSNEYSRKLVHSLHALVIAVAPFMVGYELTIIIEALFLVSVFLVSELHLFRWMWRVGRKSWGEYLFPVGVIVAALTAQSMWIYLAGVLVLGIADAVAALVGKKYGRHPYRILGQAKSLQGSVAFVSVASVILLGVFVFGPLAPVINEVLLAVMLAVGLAAIENLGVYGSDNFLLPVVTVLALNVLA
jgi:phytol kinase